MSRFIGILLLALALLGPRLAAHAQSQAEEYELKAAFLLNFARFVEWPATIDPGGPICLGVLGPDPFGEVLDRMLADQTVHYRPLAIRRFPTPDTVTPCHLVFVSAGAARTFPRESWSRPGMVAVGDDAAFVEHGGVLAFTPEGTKLRFVVNTAAAERVQVKLSSQLLKLAVRVVKDGD